MAQLKNHEADSWLARPGENTAIVLVYGPDRGLISERARKFASATGLDLDDPFAVLRLDQADIANQPDRLMTEARTISMFGDSRLIWLRNASSDKLLTETITALCEDPPVDCKLLIEAGDLKKGVALRRVVEQSKVAMAVPCYSDSGRTVDQLIDEMLTSAGMTMGLEARQILKDTLGGDRLASRSELDKLQLYCHGKTAIEPDDVLASAGDVSAFSQDSVVDSVLLGDVRNYDISYKRLIASGANPFLSLAAVMRQLQMLQLMRYRLDTGSSTPASIVGAAKPPVFFSRRKTMEIALSSWNAAMLSRATERLQQAILKTRLNAELSASICRQTLLALCLEAARLNSRR